MRTSIEMLTAMGHLTAELIAEKANNESLYKDHQFILSDRDELRGKVRDLQKKVAELESEVTVLKDQPDEEKPVVDNLLQKAQEYMKTNGNGLVATGNKIEAIRNIRALTGWGLKESKDFIDSSVVSLSKFEKVIAYIKNDGGRFLGTPDERQVVLNIHNMTGWDIIDCRTLVGMYLSK